MIGLPVKQLKRYARELGADVTDCVEKSDVVDSIGKKAKHAHWYIDIEDACILLRSVHEPKTKLEKAEMLIDNKVFAALPDTDKHLFAGPAMSKLNPAEREAHPLLDDDCDFFEHRVYPIVGLKPRSYRCIQSPSLMDKDEVDYHSGPEALLYSGPSLWLRTDGVETEVLPSPTAGGVVVSVGAFADAVATHEFRVHKGAYLTDRPTLLDRTDTIEETSDKTVISLAWEME